jgi:DNA polymerase-3 subunit gamma/tau
MQGSAATATALARAPEAALLDYPDFKSAVAMIRDRRDVPLLIDVENCLRLARYSPGRIEFEPTPAAPPDLAARLAQRLQGWTGLRWAVSVVSEGGAPTLAEAQGAADDTARATALRNPLVAAVLHAFPKAAISEIRSLETRAAEAAADALPEVAEEWDPFEDT